MRVSETDDQRRRLLAAAVPHVAFDGWTMTALEAGAADLGLAKEDAARLFPGGPVEAIVLHSAEADRSMRAAFEALDPPPARVREKVTSLIRLRLEGAADQREAVRLGLALLSRPQNAPAGLKALGRTADAIWRAAGDRSADFNWYTKRALVSAVYMATVAYWLNDRSEGFSETWGFLDRRIDNAMKIPMSVKQFGEKVGRAAPRPGRLAEALRRRRAAGGW